jgi:putative transposase
LSLIFSHTNIIAYAINNVRLLGTAGRVGTFGLDPINAWGENTSTFSEAILSKQVISVNQESPSL